MKKFLLLFVGLGLLTVFAANEVMAKPPSWRKHHRKRLRIHHAPVTPAETPKSKYKVNTKIERCWDGNKDGWIDPTESAQMKKASGKCPK